MLCCVSAAFVPKPTISGAKVLLRPFRADDVSVMVDVLADPDVRRLTGSVHSTEEARAGGDDDVDTLRTWYGSRNEQPDRLDLAVVDARSGELVGEVVLNDYDAASSSCNFRTLIGPRGRDRGLGSEAIRLIVGYGFERLGLHRIELEVYAFNPRARRAYEKAGFVVEGTRRDALRFDDEWVDATVMSILAHEWPRPTSAG